MRQEWTIAAIATGPGEGGVGIVRISGPDALGVAERCFRQRVGLALSKRRTHTAVYGWVVSREGDPIDEGIALVMRGPHSYTGEDVVELQCHGGQVALRRVLASVLESGGKLAEPGEFTKRAFLNGRIDLAQAEAVVEIIRAKTERAMAAAVSQLRGELGGAIRRIRTRLLETIAHLEADIDFPELDLEVQTKIDVQEACEWALSELTRLVAGARQGKILREGLRVVIVGRPNVGKSSLMNRLARENRSIVTEVPGTTRDVVEDWITVRGMPVVLADTAGIRETSDLVEKMGVERSRAMMEKANLALVVMDASVGFTEDDEKVLEMLPAGVGRIGVANKVDLAVDWSPATLSVALGNSPVLGVSAVTGFGMPDLEVEIAKQAGDYDAEESFVATARHEESLRVAAQRMECALVALKSGMGSDLISIDVRSAWSHLGDITGESIGEDLLEQIFSQFCIGK